MIFEIALLDYMVNNVTDVNFVNPHPPEPFPVTRPTRGDCFPEFSILNAIYPCVCYQCSL